MANTELEQELRQQLEALLDGGQAHVKLDEAITGLPFELQGRVPEGLPYSPWQLLEHIRIAQHDIVSFSDNGKGTYQPMQWPDDYWPEQAAPPDAGAWDRSVDAIRKDRAAFMAVLQTSDLTAAFPWGDGQNLLREALLIADHEAYHTGELIVARRLLGAWQPKKGHA